MKKKILAFLCILVLSVESIAPGYTAYAANDVGEANQGISNAESLESEDGQEGIDAGATVSESDNSESVQTPDSIEENIELPESTEEQAMSVPAVESNVASSETVGEQLDEELTVQDSEERQSGEAIVKYEEQSSDESAVELEEEQSSEEINGEKIKEQLSGEIDEELENLQSMDAYSLSQSVGGQCGDNLTWSIENGVLTISGTGDMWDYNSSNIYNGTCLAPWADYVSDLVTLNLEEGITHIGDYAFYGCSNFAGKLEIPTSIISIGVGAFYGCSSLTGELVLPNSITIIGSEAFQNCSGFTGNLILPDSISMINDRTFLGCSGFNGKLVLPSTIISIEYDAFSGCSNLTGELILPNNIESIGMEAFSYCEKFSGDLIIPNGITVIEHGTFYGCSGLDGKLVIPEGVTDIKNSAFYNCSNLKGNLIIPKSTTNIEGKAFQNCSGFTGNLIIPEGETGIGEASFYGCSGFDGKLVIPSSVTAIYDEAFSGCCNLSGELIIPDGVTEIGAKAFYGCKSFNGSLKLPDGIKVINERTFYECSGLTGNLVIPDSVTNIEHAAFYNCSSLNGNLVIGNSVSGIGEGAFCGCSGFTGNLFIPNSVTFLGSEDYTSWGGVFEGCSGFDGNIVIGDGVTVIGYGTFCDCSGLTGNLKIPESVTYIGGDAFYNCSGLNGNLVIPNGITNIYARTFYNCSKMTGSIIMPENVKSIGDNAFYNCSSFDGNLILGNAIETIGDNAFYNCKGLTGDLIIPDSVKTLGNQKKEWDFEYQGVFKNCSGFNGKLSLSKQLNAIYDETFSGCSGFSGTLSIPANVVDIGDKAFLGCSGFDGNLKISNRVETIGAEAFNGCSGFTGTLNIPDNVTAIGRAAFLDCKYFGGLNISNNIASIESSTFSGCSGFKGDLRIPIYLTNIGAYAFQGCSGFTGNLVIPDSIVSIGEEAFEGCSGFDGELNIPNSIISIETDTFKGCSGLVGSLTIPESVTSVKAGAFEGCSGFTGNLYISDSLLFIEDSAFSGCKNIENIYFEGDTFDDVQSIIQDLRDYNCTWYYPISYSGWKDTVQQYADLSWKPYGSGGEYLFPNLWFFVDSDAEELVYNYSNGYNIKQFDLNISAFYMNVDSSVYENCVLTIRLPEGLSFSKDENIRSITVEIACIDNTNDRVELSYPVYICATDYIDKFDIALSLTADGYEAPQTYTKSFEVSFERKDEIDEVDEYILEEVKKYTEPIDGYQALSNILESPLSDREKLNSLLELFKYYGITDVHEGVKYISNVSSHQRDFMYVATNENYCAYDYYEWLYNTPRGFAARSSLYTSGLIYNYEVFEYMDFMAYAKENLPGIEKCKKLLLEIIDTGESSVVDESIKNIKKEVKFCKNLLEINNIVNDTEANSIINQIMECTSQNELEELQGRFVDCVFQKITNKSMAVAGKEKIYVGADGITKAMGWSSKILGVACTSVEDIKSIIDLDRDVKKYLKYEKFLNTIANNTYVSGDMRAAANQLLDEINEGYAKRIQELILNLFQSITEFNKMLDTNVVNLVSKAGESTAEAGTVADALATLKLGTFIVNLIGDMGDFTKEAFYLMGYGELSTVYSIILFEDAINFRKEQTVENAWKFFEDYTMLWNLRYLGEKQYVKLFELKVLNLPLWGNVFKVHLPGYDDAYEVSKGVIENLEKCKFLLADGYSIPEGIQYIEKAVINCPVDVYVYNSQGKLIAELKDGVESDTVNEYGRFAVVYQPGNGEYAKVICKSVDEKFKYVLSANDMGLVSASIFNGEQIQSFNNISITGGDSITIEDGMYSVDRISGEGEEAQIPLSIISENTYKAVQEILIDKNNLELQVGERYALNITLLPQDATCTSISCLSFDDSVITVENGVVTAIGEGETTLLLYAMDQSGIEKEVNVKVRAKGESGSVSGTVTSFGKDSEITVCLVDQNGDTVAEAIAVGKIVEYMLDNVAVGTYTLRVSKANHILYDCPITITANNAILQNVEIWLTGDVNGDGKINAKDKKILYNHIAGSSPLTDYAFLVGDVNNDGRVNAKDKKMIYNHIAGHPLLW